MPHYRDSGGHPQCWDWTSSLAIQFPNSNEPKQADQAKRRDGQAGLTGTPGLRHKLGHHSKSLANPSRASHLVGYEIASGMANGDALV